jgi:hypothetical protein
VRDLSGQIRQGEGVVQRVGQKAMTRPPAGFLFLAHRSWRGVSSLQKRLWPSSPCALNEYTAFRSAVSPLQHCHQTQNFHCEKYFRVGRHLSQKLDHIPAPL